MLWISMAMVLIIIINPCTKMSAQERDSLFLFGGQVLIGDIKGGQMGYVTIDDKDIKVLQIKMYKIKTLKTHRRFKIEMHSKVIYYGVMGQSQSAKEGWITIYLDDGGTVETELTAINQIITLEKKFLKQLEGNLSAGFSFSKSSSVGQINLSSTVQYATELFQYQLSVSAIASIDSNEFSRDRENAGIFVSYSFKPAWFAATNLNYQRNLELSIARRIQVLLGGGNKIFLRQNWQLLGISGLSFNQEKSTSGESSGLLFEIPVAIRFNFYKYHRPNIQINSEQSVFISLSQKGRIRYDSNTSFSWELVKSFYLSFSPYANYDNQPPQGNSNFDYGVAVSLTYKF